MNGNILQVKSVYNISLKSNQSINEITKSKVIPMAKTTVVIEYTSSKSESFTLALNKIVEKYFALEIDVSINGRNVVRKYSLSDEKIAQNFIDECKKEFDILREYRWLMLKD